MTQYERQPPGSADREHFEMTVLADYLPQPLGEAEIEALIETAVASTARRPAGHGQGDGQSRPDGWPRRHGRGVRPHQGRLTR